MFSTTMRPWIRAGGLACALSLQTPHRVCSDNAHANPPARIHGRIVVENMLEVPHSVDDQSAALAEPLACVLRGIYEMEVRTGDTAAVIGCGPIGLKYVRMLSRRGLRVIALARRVAPLEVA